MSRRLSVPAGSLALVVAGSTALALRDPHTAGSWGACPFLLLTGQPCPLCGGLRAVADLISRQPVQALGSNAFVALGVVVAVVALLVWGVRRLLGDGSEPAPLLRPRPIVATGVLLVVFGVARLLPGLAWMRP